METSSVPCTPRPKTPPSVRSPSPPSQAKRRRVRSAATKKRLWLKSRWTALIDEIGDGQETKAFEEGVEVALRGKERELVAYREASEELNPVVSERRCPTSQAPASPASSPPPQCAALGAGLTAAGGTPAAASAGSAGGNGYEDDRFGPHSFEDHYIEDAYFEYAFAEDHYPEDAYLEDPLSEDHYPGNRYPEESEQHEKHEKHKKHAKSEKHGTNERDVKNEKRERSGKHVKLERHEKNEGLEKTEKHEKNGEQGSRYSTCAASCYFCDYRGKFRYLDVQHEMDALVDNMGIESFLGMLDWEEFEDCG